MSTREPESEDATTPAQPAQPATAPNADGADRTDGAYRWGQPIATGRLAELSAVAERQRVWAAQPESEREVSPLRLSGGRLTGADVFWLSALALAGPAAASDAMDAAAARLRSTKLAQRPLLDLSALHLEEADLGGAHLDVLTGVV